MGGNKKKLCDVIGSVVLLLMLLGQQKISLCVCPIKAYSLDCSQSICLEEFN